MILLSKAVDVERDHLIHRKRSPFPYEGKALTRRKVGVTANVGRDTLHFPHVLHIIAQRSAKGSEAAVHLIHRGAVPLPLKGKA